MTKALYCFEAEEQNISYWREPALIVDRARARLWVETRISPVIPHSSFHMEQSLHTPIFFLVTKLVFAHPSVVWDRRQLMDAQGHPYHSSIQRGAKEKTRREGLSAQTRGWVAAGQHSCHSLCCSFMAALLSESAPFCSAEQSIVC